MRSMRDTTQAPRRERAGSRHLDLCSRKKHVNGDQRYPSRSPGLRIFNRSEIRDAIRRTQGRFEDRLNHVETSLTRLGSNSNSLPHVNDEYYQRLRMELSARLIEANTQPYFDSRAPCHGVHKRANPAQEGLVNETTQAIQEPHTNLQRSSSQLGNLQSVIDALGHPLEYSTA